MTTLPWLLLLALAGAAMLLTPFFPAWSEWRRPTDALSLGVPLGYSREVDYFARRLRERMLAGGAQRLDGLQAPGPARFDDPVVVSGDVEVAGDAHFSSLVATGNVRLGPGSQVTQWIHADGSLTFGEGSVALRRASCDGLMTLRGNCSFERLGARTIRFGGERAVRAMAAPALVVDPMGLDGVARLAGRVFRFAGNLAIPAGSRFEGSLIVTGALSIGEDAVVEGDIKARSGISVGCGASILGALVCEETIQVLEGAFVKGPVVAEADVWLSPGVRVGEVDLPTTVTAENIVAAAGATAHGTVWARDAGISWSA